MKIESLSYSCFQNRAVIDYFGVPDMCEIENEMCSKNADPSTKDSKTSSPATVLQPATG